MVGKKMFAQVEQEEWNQWRSVSEEISVGLRDVVSNTPIGMVAQDIVYRQIRYMKSLLLEAAGRVKEIQERAIQAVINGERPDQLYEMIMQSGDVAASRARMIARTEIGRATGALTQARALSVGSEGYWWEIEGAGTRPSHRRMKDVVDPVYGRGFVRWDNPPTLDGMTGHAGCLPNCKCWPRVQIPEPRK
ncbi:phage minor head protein [Klebsiella michiganensis]|uniref:phage head morphogenesis protein n=1 Tax=Klebsiella michiganensis TaxID=1134687 RepID=UPI003B986861